MTTAGKLQHDGRRAESRAGHIPGEAGAWSREWLCPELQMTAMCPGPAALSPSSLRLLCVPYLSCHTRADPSS